MRSIFLSCPPTPRAGRVSATRIQGAGDKGPRGSSVRLLSLLAYELLGGPRTRVESTGQYTPIAALTQEGNAALRRALVDECPSAAVLVGQLRAAVTMKRSAAPASTSAKPLTPEPIPQALPPKESPPIKHTSRISGWPLILVLGVIALLGIVGGYVIYQSLHPAAQTTLSEVVFGNLAVDSDPPGATIILDQGPPLKAPHTFNDIKFGSHRLTASLEGYLPIEQDLRFDATTPPKIVLKLKQRPPQEIEALSIQSEPPGAQILLDGNPPQEPSNTFTHVPFGTHQVTASLDNYEAFKQEIQVRQGMAPQIHLQLKPSQEIATLSIQSEPPGAAILLDGKPPQGPSNTFNHVPFGTHQLTATLDNYEPIKQDIEVRRGMTPQIRLPLKPTHEIAALSIQSEPPGATILLDGKPPQGPSNTFTQIPFGTHQVTATLDNFESIKQDIEVRRGMTPQIRLPLKPTQEIAALSIQSEPPGAKILLDGKPPQAAANTFTHVPFGTHQLTATFDDYEPIKEDIEVRRGMTPQIRLPLTPIQEIAALSIQSEPPGATILLDDKPPEAPPNTFTHVPFGTHQVTATLDNYEPFKQDVEVRRGITPEIRLQLKPSQEIAALSVESDPPGAAIFLDGKPPQGPSNTFTEVPFGAHQLTATLGDYEPIKQDIEVRRGMTPQIRLKLKPDSVGALLSELKTYEEDTPQYIAGYARLVQLAPGSEEYTKELGRAIERLRKKTPPIGKDEFELNYKVNIKNAANLDLLPAILWLAENENATESLNLFLRAAKMGDSYAMMKVGRLYLRKGTPDDDVEGFEWLNRAYNSPNPNLEAGAFIGDCYLSGKGTTQDVEKAEEIIMPLASQNVVPAMTLAGRILQNKADIKRTEARGVTNPQIVKRLEAQANELDRQARQWWERAEKDDWNASARLGKYYEEGWGGLEKSEGEAEKRYKAGANHGNALSMFFYGLLIDKKPGGRSEAEKLISRAAVAGLPSAIKWCKEKNVPVGELKPADERQ